MNIDEVQLGLVKIYNECPQVYREEAEAEIKFRSIESEKEIRFAVLEMRYDTGEKVAKNKLESKVYADKDWYEFTMELGLARAEWLKKKANVKALECRLESLRSLNKTYNII